MRFLILALILISIASTLLGDPMSRPLSIFVFGDTIRGTDGNDDLSGTSDNDNISGLGGKDRMSGLGGNDKLDSDDGNDQIYANGGNDMITGGEGNDQLYSNDGNDSVVNQQQIPTKMASMMMWIHSMIFPPMNSVTSF
jgi:Ca2+-binding RTX toxin-like protein